MSEQEPERPAADEPSLPLFSLHVFGPPCPRQVPGQAKCLSPASSIRPWTSRCASSSLCRADEFTIEAHGDVPVMRSQVLRIVSRWLAVTTLSPDSPIELRPDVVARYEARRGDR